MPYHRLSLAVLFSQLGLLLAGSAAAETASAVAYGSQIAPLFAKNCVACHNAKKSEGGLDLESHAALMAGGDGGDAVIAGDADGSNLLIRMLDDDDPMPPEGNSVGAERLTADQIALVRQWINDGAGPPGESVQRQIQWQTLPESVAPIYAMDISSDGHHLAIGRGNQAFILQRPTVDTDQSFALIDPAVRQTLQTDRSDAASSSSGDMPLGAAHLDIVQSIAWRPDGLQVATGGYRTVKLWRRDLAPTAKLDSLSPMPRLAAISPDGQKIALAVGDHGLKLVDLAAGQTNTFLNTHQAKISSFAWTTDSAALLSNDESGRWVLTEIQTRTIVPLGLEPVLDCESIVFLDDRQVLALTRQGEVGILHLPEELDEHPSPSWKVFERSEPRASAIGFSSGNGGWLAIGYEDGKIQLVDAESLSEQKSIQTDGAVRRIALDDQAEHVAVICGPESVARLYRSSDGTKVGDLQQDYQRMLQLTTADRDAARQKSLVQRLENRLPQLTKAAEQEEAARDKVAELREQAAKTLAAKREENEQAGEAVKQAERAVQDAEQAVADAMKMIEQRKEELEAKKKQEEEASARAKTAADDLAKREQALATATEAAKLAAGKIPELEQTISGEKERLVALETKAGELQQAAQQRGESQAVTFSSSGDQVLVADSDGKLHRYWAADAMADVPLEAAATTLAVRSSNQAELVVVTSGGVILRWPEKSPWVWERTIGDYQESPFSDRVTALDYHPDGTTLAVGSGPPSRFGEIQLFDTRSGEIRLDLGQLHSDSVLALRFSPDGRYLASSAADKLCRIIDVQTGKPLRSLEGHTHHVLTLAWQNDGHTLVTGGADNVMKVWDTESGTQSRTINAFNKEATVVVFVGQSQQVVAASAGGELKLFNAQDGKQVRAFSGATGAVTSVAVSPDGNLLFAGGQSGEQWVWQVADGKALH